MFTSYKPECRHFFYEIVASALKTHNRSYIICFRHSFLFAFVFYFFSRAVISCSGLVNTHSLYSLYKKKNTQRDKVQLWNIDSGVSHCLRLLILLRGVWLSSVGKEILTRIERAGELTGRGSTRSKQGHEKPFRVCLRGTVSTFP